MYIMQNIIGKLILSVIFLIICFIYVGFYFASGNIHINEVMYDINGTDTDHEWLEVYNNCSEEINLSGWKFFEGGTNHAITLYYGKIELDIGDYAVIVQDPETFLIDNPNFQGNILDSSFSLSNTGELIAIKNSSLFMIDELNYSLYLSANGDGNSLQYFNNTWQGCFPTPGFENNCSVEITEENESNITIPPSDSYIEIMDYPEKADFGEEIDLEFHVYKGDTGKYAVYIYMQNDDGNKVSEKITVHAGTSSTSSKFQDYYFKEEILLKCLDESGDYELVIEGLDTIETREIEIEKCEDLEGEETQTSSSKTEYFVENIEDIEKIKIGEKINILVKIVNNENFEKSFLVWSYIYNGPKCYSCIDNREENSQQISIGSFSEEIIYLENIVNSASVGEYNLKIKILKDGLKTPRELTYPVYLENSEETLINTEYGERITGNVIQPNNFYSINEMKSKKSIFLEATPYLLSTLAMLFCVYLVVKKI